MQRSLRLSIIGIVIIFLGLLGWNRPAVPFADAVAEKTVLVELFTSQGCSSCPPADRLVSLLPDRYKGQITIIPLAYHVDYWDDNGWKDPFSDSAYTRRQQAYCARLSPEWIYTPQAVFDGRMHRVGNDPAKVDQAICLVSNAEDSIRLTVDLKEFEETPNQLQTVIKVEKKGALLADTLDVMVALVENGLETEIPSGENHGKRLHSDSVVRRLVKAGTWNPTNESQTFTTAFRLEPGWILSNLGVVAFAQEPGQRAVHGVGVNRAEGKGFNK